ncbi:aminotransferase class III-fold pyridoxal phosphate-dependent enzyme, partial [Candidatus Micrarchaeota archaeon]|nr:aminotransferase class III-fold pyridoxal phosphate-dependent enzyme [Candidatus Micrarchaeota archaeon]
LGHRHPVVQRAVQKQLDKAWHAAIADFYAEPPVALAEMLCEEAGKPFDSVFFSNSGAESVECALKLARHHSGKEKFVAFHPCFHGRTLGALSLTDSRPAARHGFGNLFPVFHTPYAYPYGFNGTAKECVDDCLSRLDSLLANNRLTVAAVFLEPCAMEAGVIVPPKEFVRGVRKVTLQHGTILVADEVQTGFYRSGEFLASDRFGITPDVVCMAKAIGGGIPLGATLASRKVMDWESGAHANTFGGNLLACAAGIAALGEARKLGKHVKKEGEYFLRRLKEFEEEFSFVGEVRGLGFMLGLEIVDRAGNKDGKTRYRVLYELFRRGVLSLGAGENVVRFLPPLNATRAQIDLACSALGEALKEVGGGI